MSAHAEPVNGQSHLIDVEVPILDFTQPTPLRIKKAGATVVAYLRPRTIKDISNREKAIRRESLVIDKNETEERGQSTPGNVALFDATVERAERLDEVSNVAREYTREECLRFTAHDKNKFISKLFRVKTTVQGVDSDGDPMLDAAGEVCIRQIFGEPSDPEHVVDYRFRLPDQRARDAYEGSNRLRINRGGDKPIYRMLADVEKAYAVGLGLFVSASGAIGEAHQIDPWCLLEATAALMLEVDRDEDFS